MSTEPTLDTAAGFRPAPPANRSPRRFGRIPLILITSPAGFAIVVVATVLIVASSRVVSLPDVTSAEFAESLGLIIGRGVTYLIAISWGAVGMGLLARRVVAEGGSRPLAVGSLVCTGLSVLAAAGQVVIPLTAVGFTASRYAETPAFDWQLWSSLLAIWCAILALALAALAVRGLGIRTTAMLILALVSAAYLIVDVTTRGGFPPFVIALLWLAFGLCLRTSRVEAVPRTLMP